MTDTVKDDPQAQRQALSRHVLARVPDMLAAWRKAIDADPRLCSGDALPRGQLLDHLPKWLETFAKALASSPEEAATQRLVLAEARNATAHGLQRWQQGYDLHEVTREWGALHRVLVAELERAFAVVSAAPDVASGGHETLAWFISEATSESAAEYFRLERLEAAGAVSDLELALENITQLEQSRAELWQQAAHDLRGNLGVVANVASGLRLPGLPPERRDDFIARLGNNVGALHRLLDDVTDLARLHAGQERLKAAAFDADAVLRGLCEDLRPVADHKKLFLRTQGSGPLPVEGDAVKVRRIAQNLLLNALKYTETGGVVIAWGDTPGSDDGRWWLSIEDTGPGFHAGPGAPMVSALVTVPGEPPPVDARPVHQAGGEGLGLAIVKRLCELLSASVELETGPGKGTTMKVLIPRHYSPAAAAG